MVIVRLQGRLGNQMFQYALARSLQYSGKEVFLDSSMLKYDGNHNELGIFEHTKAVCEAKSVDVRKFGDCNKQIIFKLKRKVLGYKKTHYLEKGYQFHPEIFDMDQVYLEGYWQTEKYFSKIEEVLRKDFTFPTITDENNRKLVSEIQGCQAVSMHIRRGDYLSEKNAPMHGNICTKEYYERAISYIRENVENPIFFVFTDDADWARQEYGNNKEFMIVDNNHGEDSYRDMQLMSLCKHHIIANSSFSWWGAWLNPDKEKIVVAPSKWFNLAETPDIWCEGWKIINN